MDKTQRIIETLDWNIALQYAINSEESAKNLLTMLVESFSEIELKINIFLDNYLLDEEFCNSELLLVIHKLHGSCDYCGVMKLKALCQYIEQQLRQEISAIALFPELLELIDEFDNIRLEANKRLAI